MRLFILLLILYIQLCLNQLNSNWNDQVNINNQQMKINQKVIQIFQLQKKGGLLNNE